jgi:hypothetical protein
MQQYLIVEDAVAHAVDHGTKLLRAAREAASDGRSDSSGTFRLNAGFDLDSVRPLEAVLLHDESSDIITASQQGEALVQMLGGLMCPLTLRRKAESSAARLVRRTEALGLILPANGQAFFAPRPEVGDLFAFAQTCATDHCVAGTYSAARFALLARVAGDAGLGRVWSEVADDQLSRAVLAWELLDWAQSQLSPARRRLIRDEQRKAFEQLRGCPGSQSGALAQLLDGSEESIAAGLLDALELGLWGENLGRETKAS